MSTLKLNEYDAIGFDLDNTLLEYNLSKLFQLQYEFLSNYMVDKKGYNRSFFPPKLTLEDADFFQRGLFLDFKRGNILKLRHDGFIIKATHGTRLLKDEEIEKEYGKSRCWSVLNSFIKDKLSIWYNNETRTFLDFTDTIGTLIFGKAVDSVTTEAHSNPKEYNVWPDLLESIIEMYKPDSTYLKSLSSNPLAYARQCDDSVIAWLRKLKKHSKLILITSAEPEVIKLSLPFCFKNQHSNLFDLIVCEAKKPGFFSINRPFMTLAGEKVSQITWNTKEDIKIYRQGNWAAIHEILQAELGQEPKCVYVGDNPLQDIYAPTRIPSKLDSLAIVEELASEGLDPDSKDYSHSMYVSSKFWGPFLHTSSGESTIMGKIFEESAKLIASSIKVLASKPTDYEHKSII